MSSLQNTDMAYTLLRLALGLNIFIHGLGRLGPNYQKFVDWTLGLFQGSPLPEFAVTAFAHSIPVLELVIGGLVLLGLFTFPALIAGTLVMIALMTGMCVLQKWEIVGIQMNYILLYSILIFFLQNNQISVDALIFKK